MNLDILESTFPVAEHPGLSTLDPRWSEITGFVQSGQFAEAARQSEALLREGVCDVRLVGYLCFGHFLDQGPNALTAILTGLQSVLNGNWDAVGPVGQRPKATQQSFTWLLKLVLKNLQREESTKSDVWQKWTNVATAELVEEAVSGAFLLQQAIESRLGDAAPPVIELIGKLQAWLRSFQNAVPRPTKAAAVGAAEKGEKPDAVEAPSSSAPVTLATGNATVAGSYHLNLLVRKMDAFAVLLEQGKLASARLVAEDIGDVLSHFDPLLYFPSIFSRFSRLMAEHASEMAEVEHDPEASTYKARRALYHVDLDQFLELK